MDAVRKPINSVCYTPSSEPYRIYKYIIVDWGSVEKFKFYRGSNIICFTFYIHLWPIHWLSLVLVRLQCTDPFYYAKGKIVRGYKSCLCIENMGITFHTFWTWTIPGTGWQVHVPIDYPREKSLRYRWLRRCGAQNWFRSDAEQKQTPVLVANRTPANNYCSGKI
jgi:hypothetical protein